MAVIEEPRPNPEADHLAWMVARMSAAALGHLKPGEAYPGKPLAPVEEILRLRLAATTLAESEAQRLYGPTFKPADTDTILNEALKAAAEKLPIPYAVPKEEV